MADEERAETRTASEAVAEPASGAMESNADGAPGGESSGTFGSASEGPSADGDALGLAEGTDRSVAACTAAAAIEALRRDVGQALQMLAVLQEIRNGVAFNKSKDELIPCPPSCVPIASIPIPSKTRISGARRARSATNRMRCLEMNGRNGGWP